MFSIHHKTTHPLHTRCSMRNTPRPFPILRSADAGTDRCRPSTAAAPSHRIQGAFHEDVAHQDHQCCTCGAAIRHPSDEQSGVCTCQGTSGSQCTECTAHTWLPRIGKRGGSNFRWVCFEAGGGGGGVVLQLGSPLHCGGPNLVIECLHF